MLHSIAVFCGSHLGCNPHFQSAAQELGQLIASQGRRLIYGGSDLGYMGIVSTAALDGGGQVVSVIPDLFPDAVIQSQPRAETRIVHSMQERKRLMLEISDAFVALPGGVGTLDELFEVMMSNQLGIVSKPVGLLNVDGYYDPLLAMLDRMRGEGQLNAAAASRLIVRDRPAELLEALDGRG